jgi:hypothetical protein
MPYDMNWYVPGHIVYVRFEGDVTVDEFRAFMVRLFTLFDQSQALLVHVIADNRRVTHSLSIREIVGVVKKPHAKMGWYIEINTNVNPVRFIANIASQIFRIRNRTVPTLDEATAFLRNQDHSIAWDKTDDSVIASS